MLPMRKIPTQQVLIHRKWCKVQERDLKALRERYPKELCGETAKTKLQPNHLEERLSDQAPARASYTPLFWGHSRSIPQGMTFDVQPLVNSLFCPIRQTPNGFFDSEASIP